MDTQNPIPGQTTSSSNDQTWREQWRAERRALREQWRAERRAWRAERWQGRRWYPASVFVGVFLILLGGAFFLQNVGLPLLVNWWALFILMPAFGAFVAAWNEYLEDGKLTRRVIGALTIGILLTIVALIFLLNLAIGVFWPVLLIAGGLALMGIDLFSK